jgi:hypothetical protein
MPVIKFQCDTCGARLQATAERAGQKGKCTKCGSLITVPSTAPNHPAATGSAPPEGKPRPVARKSETAVPAVDEEDVEAEDEEQPRRRADTRAGWRKVSLGLLLILGAAGGRLVLGVLGFVGAFAFLTLSKGLGLGGLFFLTGLGVAFTLLLEVATVGGYALCCFVPRRHGAKNLIVTTLVLGVLSMATIVTGRIIEWKLRPNELPTDRVQQFQSRMEALRQERLTPDELREKTQSLLREHERELAQGSEVWARWNRITTFWTRLASMLYGAQYLTFAFFLSGLARSLGASGVAENCLNLIKLSASLLLVQLAFQVVTGLMLGAPSLFRLIGILAYAIGLATLAQTVWFLTAVHAVRGLVRKQARRRGQG